MKPSIKFEEIWNDEDLIELRVTINNGKSQFSNCVYLGHHKIDELYQSLDRFKSQYYGGLRDIYFGQFGMEYANGAFHARLHFPKPGNLYIATKQQSEFFKFKGQEVASEAEMYLTTEPVLFDNFLLELKSLRNGNSKTAELECI